MSNVEVIFEISLPSCSIKLKEEEARALYVKLYSIFNIPTPYTDEFLKINSKPITSQTDQSTCIITVKAKKND